jgi:ATP-dependent Lhr-like helicase
VDLVCLIGSPRSIAAGLQRIGRAGHAVGGTPKGRLFPLTRDQLVECAALVRAARRGRLDAIALREAPLDILAQQIVAACGCGEWDEDELFETYRRAAAYGALERHDFDAIVDVLAEGIATSRGRSGALLHRDAVHRKLRGRRGARLAALTSGGAIPDTALYDVVLEPEGTLVGTVDEDFAIESMAGDIILLGNTSWRIRRVETGRVRVEDAAGAPPTVPFWFGEGPARTRELSAEVGDLKEELLARAGKEDVDAVLGWLESACALDRAVARLLVDYVLAGKAALGAVPSQRCVIAERFFDEAGGTQLILHAPFGGRINRAWGMALRKRFCRTFDFELQAAATDDGVLLSLGPQHSFPLETILQMVRPEDVDELLTQAALQAPMFETRWRWNATRSLALLRHRGGKKVPPNLQRMRAQDLLAAVFPMQVGCQDNHGGGPIEVPDHPLVKETVRDCLVEAMDAAGFKEVLRELVEGRIRTVTRETPEPSAFAHEILNSNPYTFLDDAPLEERRSRAVTVRRGLPAELVERLGGLDPAAVRLVVDEAQPDARGADELHDVLLELGALPAEEGLARGWQKVFDTLVAARRAATLTLQDRRFWVAAERRSLAVAAWPAGVFQPDLVEPPARSPRPWAERDGALVELARGALGILGPTTAAALADRFGLKEDEVEGALAALELAGAVMRGQFLGGAAAEPLADPAAAGAADRGTSGALEWCDRRLLARIHRYTLDRLRREIEPVSAADFMRFLLSWQHVRPDGQRPGRDGLRQVIEQLQGFEAAAGAWEKEILPARVAEYDSRWLDDLCLGGEVVWGRLEARVDGGGTPSRAAPLGLALRADLPWLLAPREGLDDDGLSAKARDVLAHLRRAGASFFEDLLAGTRRLRAELEEALWELVAAGRITCDGFGGLRALLPQTPQGRRGPRARWYGNWVARQQGPRGGSGRWSLLQTHEPVAEEDRIEALARQYVRRYGVVFREVLAREGQAPPWRELLRVYRRLEMRGELRGGRLVGGFVGEQFASPEAVEALRATRRQPRTGEVIALSACDPLNLVGILTPGPRIPATLNNEVVYRDGVPVDASGAPADAQGEDQGDAQGEGQVDGQGEGQVDGQTDTGPGHPAGPPGVSYAAGSA